MTTSSQLLLMHDVADGLLESADGRHLGRVADVLLADDGQGLVVEDLAHGPEALARRAAPFAAGALAKWLRGRHERSVSIDEVRTFGPTLVLRGAASEYDLANGDDWAARLLRFIPGSGVADRSGPPRRSARSRSHKRTIWVSELLGTPVRDKAGGELGHLTEVRITPRSHRVVELLVGRHGWLVRLGVRALVQRLGWREADDTIPWDRVESWTKDEIRIRG